MVYLITGKAGAGKSKYSNNLAAELREEGKRVYVLDGDEWRNKQGNHDYSDEGRLENLMSAAEFAQEMETAGITVIVAFISPKRAWRDNMRALWQKSHLIYIPGGTLWPGTTYERPEDDEY